MSSKRKKPKTDFVVCARCGSQRHGSGFRSYRNGVGYCDTCAALPTTETWLTSVPWTWNHIVYQVTETY